MQLRLANPLKTLYTVAVLCCTDVAYGKTIAVASAVVFEHWESDKAAAVYTTQISQVSPYQPGEFFRRELPCLERLLNEVPERLDAVIVDGHAWLGEERPGLGALLHQSSAEELAVIGIAKNPFKDNTRAREVKRGQSEKALWVSVAGDYDLEEACLGLARMKGPFRIPTLLKLADSACREGLKKCLPGD